MLVTVGQADKCRRTLVVNLYPLLHLQGELAQRVVDLLYELSVSADAPEEITNHTALLDVGSIRLAA